MNSLRAWLVFVRERFEPLSHLAMISAFYLSHVVCVQLSNLGGTSAHPVEIALLGIAVVIFFFKLRLYDDIKDYEYDVKHNPERPLARGLLKRKDLHQGIIVCIALELLFFSVVGWQAIPAIVFAIAYSLLMYREFFIPHIIRPLLTTYAISHTVVSFLLSLAIFAALTGYSAFSLTHDMYFFAIATWMMFNIFEFGRKTFSVNEEREGVASYSKIFGRFGAVAMVLGMSAIALFLFLQTRLRDLPGFTWVASLMVLVLAFSGMVYAFSNRAAFGAAYRAISSLYIVVIYGAIVIVYPFVVYAKN